MKSSDQLLEWPRLTAAVARFAESPLGRAQADRLQPLADPERLARLHAAVREAGALLLAHDGALLAGAGDLRPLLEQGKRAGGRMEGRPLHEVLQTLNVARRVRERLAAAGENLRARGEDLPRLDDLLALLDRCIDPDGSVPDRAAPELSALRREHEDGERKVRRLAQRLREHAPYQAALREGPPVRRNGRLMLAVRGESRALVPGVLHDQSSSGSTVFVEPFELVEPQNRLAEVRLAEQRLVGRILLECSREVLAREGEIHELLRQLGSLDLLLARARFGQHLGGILPAVGAGPLTLRGAYHPLLLQQRLDAGDDLAQARQRVVPFDLTLGEAFDVLVITGPNTGGKTVTLKAVGLLALMALAGVPGPLAEGSRVPQFDAVHADIGDEQDLQQSLSTFSGHLHRISALLARTTAHSLVLLDELGSGTDPAEGEALGRALLRHLRRVGARVIATTHLSGLKDLGCEEERIENASLEFDVESLRPLFRLTVGLPGESNALRIATRHGIPAPIVAAARADLVRRRGADSVEAAEVVQRSRARALQHLDEARRHQAQTEAARAELEQKVREWEQWAANLETQKQQEIDRQLAQASRRGRELLARLGTVPAKLVDAVRELDEFLAGLAGSSALAARREAYLRSRKRDDLVYLPRYRESCRVRKVDRARRMVTVLYRSLPLEVAYSEVACPDDYPWEGSGTEREP